MFNLPIFVNFPEFLPWSSQWQKLHGFMVAVLAIGFLSGESCWGPLWSSLLRSVRRSSVIKTVGILRVARAVEVLNGEGPWQPWSLPPYGCYW